MDDLVSFHEMCMYGRGKGCVQGSFVGFKLGLCECLCVSAFVTYIPLGSVDLIDLLNY